jgi:L-aspartate oxidase
MDAIKGIEKNSTPFRILDVNDVNKDEYSQEKIQSMLLEVKKVMSKNVGVFTNDQSLKKAFSFITNMQEKIEIICQKYKVTISLLELRNISLVSFLIIQQSLARKENKGVFYNEDLVK